MPTIKEKIIFSKNKKKKLTIYPFRDKENIKFFDFEFIPTDMVSGDEWEFVTIKQFSQNKKVNGRNAYTVILRPIRKIKRESVCYLKDGYFLKQIYSGTNLISSERILGTKKITETYINITTKGIVVSKGLEYSCPDSLCIGYDSFIIPCSEWWNNKIIKKQVYKKLIEFNKLKRNQKENWNEKTIN